jgi:putative hydrolase of the HAD superfamily
LLPARWQGASAGVKNLRLVDLLVDILAENDISTIPSDRLVEASELYQTAICSQATMIAGARDVLSQVKAAGFKIGLVSNTMFTGAAHKADLERFALLGFFDTTLFSADVNKWKPNPDPFWHVLETLASIPETAVYIGDDPRSDILGGQRAGMRTIHFQSSQRFSEPDGLKPDARIHNLVELMPILYQWGA